jgi:hypothetical protein
MSECSTKRIFGVIGTQLPQEKKDVLLKAQENVPAQHEDAPNLEDAPRLTARPKSELLNALKNCLQPAAKKNTHPQ